MTDLRRASCVLLVVGAGCLPEQADGDVDSGPRMLDVTCADGVTCKTSGNTRLGEGIASDAVAYHLGPGGGRVEIPLVDAKERLVSASLEVLVRGRGAVVLRQGGQASGPRSLGGQAVWMNAPSSQTPDGRLVVEAADDQSEVVLLDVRFSARYDVGGCSVSAVGRRGGQSRR